MPHESATTLRAPIAVAALCTLLAVLPGCALLDTHTGPARPASPDPSLLQAAALPAHLAALQRLIQTPAADQAALLAAAQKDYETNPSPEHQLHYALMLATPGHAATNPSRAEQLLQPLATLPGGDLSTGEQALAIVELQNVQRILALDTDNQRLTQSLPDRNERDRAVANSRRLQQELDENAKLHRDLDEARAKLDAIANIERSASRPTP